MTLMGALRLTVQFACHCCLHRVHIQILHPGVASSTGKKRLLTASQVEKMLTISAMLLLKCSVRVLCIELRQGQYTILSGNVISSPC